MKLGVLFSGGKDSTLALEKAMEHDEVTCLISIISKNTESYMFHTPNIHLVEKQAEVLGLPLIRIETEGVKEEELEQLGEALIEAKTKYAIAGVVTGAVGSIYQAERIQKICNDLSLWCFNPLWQRDQVDLLNEIVGKGYEVIITGVFAYPLDKEWAGRKLDKTAIEELKQLQERMKLNPAGEGGETESTVLSGPIFKKKIVVEEAETTGKGNSFVYKIKKVKLE